MSLLSSSQKGTQSDGQSEKWVEDGAAVLLLSFTRVPSAILHNGCFLANIDKLPLLRRD